jgi:hypothetical protein
VLLLVVVLLLPACKSGMPWEHKSNQPVAQQPADPLTAKEPYTAPVVEAPGLALSPDQRFKDIPLPVGLKEDLERTFVYQSSTLEVGRMVYSTRSSVYDLTQFFLTECPTAGWKLRNVLEAEAKTLVFTKPGKELEIVVTPLSVTTGRRVSITLRPATEAGL